MQSLIGKLPGVQVNDSGPGQSVIRIRGLNSLAGDEKVLYVLNGVLMEVLPAGFDISSAQVNILDGATATSLYGSSAANGAIVITTPEFVPKALRDQFRDYAFWQPNLLTDKNGEVKFRVTYPDNITGWQTFVVGMDKKRRIAKATYFTKAYKPLLAQLSAPQFLVEGDSSSFIGKAINYTSDPVALTMDFQLNKKIIKTGTLALGANASVIDPLEVVAANTDTITAQYMLGGASGYKDGELRKIPVFRKGIEETIGQFWILDKDTSFSFIPDENAGSIVIHAQANTLDMLLDELKYLEEYPYFCMEQTASKLAGLAMEKRIRNYLGQAFKGEKQMQQLLQKLQKAQLFNGGWGWWQSSPATQPITNYILRTLLDFRGDVLVETNIRNGLLYLQNELPSMRRSGLLEALFTLSEAGHDMNYGQYLEKIPFDSLTIYEQWQVVKIRLQRKMEYRTELKKVMDKKTETMLGGLYWGAGSYDWQNNDMATTVLAFKVLEQDGNYSHLLKQVTQFFLERRSGGRWRNTIESATIVAAILPTILQENDRFQEPAMIDIRMGSANQEDRPPFTKMFTNNGQPVLIKRSGGAIVYLTAWQKIFNHEPLPVNDKFRITTFFEKSGMPAAELVSGEKTTMRIKIDVSKDAEYVAIEIPIPAGCTYVEKRQDDFKIHKEFLKNKLVYFIEKMNKGIYEYEIELEPRYSGTYHLNPTRAELMYFPLINGRNEMKKITIKN